MKRGFYGRTIKHAEELEVGDVVWTADVPTRRYTIVRGTTDMSPYAMVGGSPLYGDARFGRAYIITGRWRYERASSCPFAGEKDE